MGTRIINDEPASPPERYQIGGNAFPTEDTDTGLEGPGLSALDYFAAAALSVIGVRSSGKYCNEIAVECYDIAAAMLTERDKRNKIT